MTTSLFRLTLTATPRTRRSMPDHHKADVFQVSTGSWCWSCLCGEGAVAGRTRTDRQWMSAAAVLHEAARAQPPE